jgi:DNA (cytosine-5)-methyltransferase 1
MKDIVLIDLFSGVGGFALALERAGMNITDHYFSEIDKNAISVYKYHFKEANYVGSVVDFSGAEIRRKHPGARIIVCFGWPCQDNSIAGKRKGHAGGTRSSLLIEAIRIIQEVQPDYFIAENVKGLYSVNEGADFIEAIRLLSYLDGDSPQYIVEQQLFNTTWILPQNRERTYFVGYPREGGFRSILPIREADTEDIRQEAERDLRERVQSREDAIPGRYGVVHNKGDINEIEVSTSIDASYYKSMDNHGQRTMVLCDSGKGRQLQERDTLAPLRSNTGAGHGNYIVYKRTPLKFLDRNGKETDGKYAFTIDSMNTGGVEEITNNSAVRIRRLTEIECNRLQGFPDGWCSKGVEALAKSKKGVIVEFHGFGDKVVEISSTQQYKQMGNAVSVPMPQLIAIKILQHS